MSLRFKRHTLREKRHMLRKGLTSFTYKCKNYASNAKNSNKALKMLSWKMSVSQVINESAKVGTRQYLWKDESTSNI